jgi:V8-like Glu-specific endopeptidase
MKTSLPLFALIAFGALAYAADPVTAPAPLAKPEETGVNFARTFPYSMIGQLRFSNGSSWYIGSGTVVKPRSVLTAAHNLWSADDGFSTDILFRRSLAGDSAASAQYARRIYVLSGYRENARQFSSTDPRAFSYDTGGLVFRDPVANGSNAGWWANSALLSGSAPMLALGYGGEFHSGNDLLSVAPTQGFYPVAGAFWNNLSVFCESGMSGGPVFSRNADGKLFVTGVVVAGSNEPASMGIRILDKTAADFIQQYLK